MFSAFLSCLVLLTSLDFALLCLKRIHVPTVRGPHFSGGAVCLERNRRAATEQGCLGQGAPPARRLGMFPRRLSGLQRQPRPVSPEPRHIYNDSSSLTPESMADEGVLCDGPLSRSTAGKKKNKNKFPNSCEKSFITQPQSYTTLSFLFI